MFFLDPLCKDITGSHKSLTYDLDFNTETWGNIRSLGSIYMFGDVFNFHAAYLLVYQQIYIFFYFLCCFEIKGQKINGRLLTNKLGQQKRLCLDGPFC